MYLVRDVFSCLPGEAKLLVGKFKAVIDHFEEFGFKNARVMTDTVAAYWTVVLEFEVDSPGAYFDASANMPDDDERFAPMEGYMDHVSGGYREIFKIE